ncbi:MAG: hypothetical protein H0V07_08830, partial [Propionibacteriales bacterium]|nr:hypothetical protein [Propionibacteriales bacterium]
PVFIASERVAYLDLGWRNVEFYGYPMGPAYPHVKAFEWELRLAPDDTRIVRLPEGLAIELKYLDANELSHWTSADAFATSARTARKRREWEVSTALAAGNWKDLEGVLRIESPAHSHVIDYLTQQWLPAAERPLVNVARGMRH